MDNYQEIIAAPKKNRRKKIEHVEPETKNIWTEAKKIFPISNGNRTEWSPIRSVIIRVITKSDDRAAGVRFVCHEYDYRQNWTTRSLVTN